MNKLTILIGILALAFLLGIPVKETEVGTVIVNLEKFPDKAVRQELKACIEGEDGMFSKEMEMTLYTAHDTIMQYRTLKSRLESWGARVILRRETEENIFDFRALGELYLYIWEGADEDIYEAFLSKNSVFYSTGYSEKGYDKLLAQGNTEGAAALLRDNISVITK